MSVQGRCIHYVEKEYSPCFLRRSQPCLTDGSSALPKREGKQPHLCCNIVVRMGCHRDSLRRLNKVWIAPPTCRAWMGMEQRHQAFRWQRESTVPALPKIISLFRSSSWDTRNRTRERPESRKHYRRHMYLTEQNKMSNNNTKMSPCEMAVIVINSITTIKTIFRPCYKNIYIYM